MLKKRNEGTLKKQRSIAFVGLLHLLLLLFFVSPSFFFEFFSVGILLVKRMWLKDLKLFLLISFQFAYSSFIHQSIILTTLLLSNFPFSIPLL